MNMYRGRLLDATPPKSSEGVWCLEMNGEIIFHGRTTTFKDGGNITSVVRRIQQGEIPGDSKGRKVIRFFEEHIRPILECSAAPSFFHEADIPKACAVFWNINCQFSYEKIDTRKPQWKDHIQHKGLYDRYSRLFL